MAKSSDQRLDLEAELTSRLVDLGALNARLAEASEFATVTPPVTSSPKRNKSEPVTRVKSNSTKKRKRQRPPSVYDLVDRAAYLPVTYDLADRVPIDDEGPGRPRLHPVFANFVYLAAVPDQRSYWKTDSAFDNDFMWRRARRLINEAWAFDPAYDISDTPIAYSHACRFFDRHVVGQPDVIATLYECYVRFSVELAHRMEVMDGSPRTPTRTRAASSSATPRWWPRCSRACPATNGLTRSPARWA